MTNLHFVVKALPQTVDRPVPSVDKGWVVPQGGVSMGCVVLSPKNISHFYNKSILAERLHLGLNW